MVPHGVNSGGNSDPCLRCSAYIVDACLVGRARGGCPYQKINTIPGPRAGRASGEES